MTELLPLKVYLYSLNSSVISDNTYYQWGVSGCTLLLGKLPVTSVLLRQDPRTLEVCAGGGCLDFVFSCLSFLSSVSF